MQLIPFFAAIRQSQFFFIQKLWPKNNKKSIID